MGSAAEMTPGSSLPENDSADSVLRFPHTASQAGLGAAHGKTILLGEHSVVYGTPAVVLPLLDLQAAASVREASRGLIDSDLYTGPISAAPKEMAPVVTAIQDAAERVDVRADRIEVTLRSTIPFERGLGSSAAVAAAIVRAVANAAGRRLSPAENHELVQRAETVAHGTSSGMDGHAVQSLVPLRFQAGKPTQVKVAGQMTFVIADTGTVGSTAAAVNGVRMLREVHPRRVDRLLDSLGALSDDGVTALATGDGPALGRTMTSAHEHLATLGVSAPALDALVGAAEDAGALGAKLTGSGLGGCALALAPDQESAGNLAAAMTAVGATRVWTTSLAPSNPSTETAPTARITEQMIADAKLRRQNQSSQHNRTPQEDL